MIGFVTLQTERRNQMGWLANINNVKFSKAVVRITGNPINMGSGIFHWDAGGASVLHAQSIGQVTAIKQFNANPFYEPKCKDIKRICQLQNRRPA